MSVVVVSSALLWILACAAGWLGYQLLRQGGRILVRLETLDEMILRLRQSADSLAHVLASNQPRVEATQPAPPPSGLPLGSAAPVFELPDLSGRRHSLSQFRGRQSLLIFFNPQCGFCVQMLPRLAAAETPNGDGQRSTLLIVTTGDAAENRRLIEQHTIRSRVLLQEKMEVASQYRVHGTPIGYLLDEEGRIASETLIGADALLEVWNQRCLGSAPRFDGNGIRHDEAANGHGGDHHVGGHGNRSLAESRIVRDGLRAGTPAPHFRLPRVDGLAEIDLTDYRGRSVLLVFSDPHCGPCAHVSPQLESLHRSRQDLSVLMVSRGGVEDNRRKIEELALTFPVALQKQWEISRLYGMFATPIGYLINPDGVLAADVAVGAEAILSLAARDASTLQSHAEVVS